MIRILKHGHLKRATCHNCKTYFEFIKYQDTHYDDIGCCFIKCPVCKLSIGEDDWKDEEQDKCK